MRWAKLLAECFASAKYSSEDNYISGHNYFRSGYLCMYVCIWHWLKCAFNAWFLWHYMANWEKVQSCTWCQIVGNLLVYVPFFSVCRYVLWLTFYKLLKKKRFSGFHKQKHCLTHDFCDITWRIGKRYKVVLGVNL